MSHGTINNSALYLKDPRQNTLLNTGVASVNDAFSPEERRTLRYELETFVCEGEYARGLRRILETFLANLDNPEQPGVWVSGFFGSGKSHLVKVLRALWVDYRFPEDNATARGLTRLPVEIADTLRELSVRGRQVGGVHAASGTLGGGVGDNVRMTVLGIVFRSVGLSEQYPIARFEMWLKREGHYEAVRAAIEAEGKDWRAELGHLYVSPLITKALLEVYPGFASSPAEARKLLKEQFPNVQDISNQQLMDGIRQALAPDGKFPLTLVALDEVQQYIGENQPRSILIQEVTETCCKAFAGRLLFVGTGQTALSGTPLLKRLIDRFAVAIELSDTDVDAVIRKVILAKKPDCLGEIDNTLTQNLGEISRHLAGTRIEHRAEDRAVLTADYPILPVRRRFWERALRSVDQAGTAGQLRNQLKLVHEAARATADDALGTVVGGDFIFHQIAPNLLQTGVLPRETYDYIRANIEGNSSARLKARLCALVYLIGKLPREGGADLGMRATPDVLADLLVQDLPRGSAELRRDVPGLLEALEADGKLMRVGAEYRLQTRESGVWTDEYRRQYARIEGDPVRIPSERAELLRKECAERLKSVRLSQGKSKVPRSIAYHFGTDAPADTADRITVWVRDGWQDDEKAVQTDARQAGNDSPLILLFLPMRASDELRTTLTTWRAAQSTLQVRGVPSTVEGIEARRAMETRSSEAERRLTLLIDDVFSGARVYQAGGQEVIGPSLSDSVRLASENAMVRLFPMFDMADHTGWEKVVTRAREGSQAALEAVDYKGDIDRHPVSLELLKFIAGAKKGSEIRARYESSPFGWPRDTVDGALYALVACGHLRALDASQKLIDASTLDRSKLTQTSFKLEVTTVTTPEKLAVRKLLTEIGIPCNPGDELVAIARMLDALKHRADGAGGPAPRPERPDTKELEALRSLIGNEQLKAVYNQRESLAAQATTWANRGKLLQVRLPRWSNLESLLTHAATLPETPGLQQQTDAIFQQRLLLSEPDPVPPLCEHLTQLLRTALLHLRDQYDARHATGMETLKHDENWQKLTPDTRNTLLRDNQLLGKPPVNTGNEAEVLASLKAMNLGTWADRIAALPGRFQQVRLDAATHLEPQVIQVQLPKPGILKNEAAVKTWLAEVEKTLLEALQKGPVVIH